MTTKQESNQLNKALIPQIMDHSWHHAANLSKQAGRHIYQLIKADCLGHISRHFFGKYNTANSNLDQLGTRLTDLFACITNQIIFEDLFIHSIFRLALNLGSAISIAFAIVHLCLQTVLLSILLLLQMIINFCIVFGKNIICELILLKLMPNIIAVFFSLPICILSSAARKQTSIHIENILENFSSILKTFIYVPYILIGHYKLKLCFEPDKPDPQKLNPADDQAFWREIPALLSASKQSLVASIQQIYENTYFIFLTPMLLSLTWLCSTLLFARGVIRIALSPISVLMPPIQKIIFGEETQNCSYSPLSKVLNPSNLPTKQNSDKIKTK